MVVVNLFVWVKSATKNQLANVICFQLLIHSNLTEIVYKQTQREWGFGVTRKSSQDTVPWRVSQDCSTVKTEVNIHKFWISFWLLCFVTQIHFYFQLSEVMDLLNDFQQIGGLKLKPQYFHLKLVNAFAYFKIYQVILSSSSLWLVLYVVKNFYCCWQMQCIS